MSAEAGTPQVSRTLRIVADAGLGHGELTEVPVTEIGSGELLLRASHSSVNYKDALAATGRGKVVRRYPLIGGIDVVGEVVESADPAYLPGDHVLVTGFGLSEDHDGGYASLATQAPSRHPSRVRWTQKRCSMGGPGDQRVCDSQPPNAALQEDRLSAGICCDPVTYGSSSARVVIRYVARYSPSHPNKTDAE